MVDSGWKRLAVTVGAGLALIVSAMPVAAVSTSRSLGPDTQFYVRHPDQAARAQLADLRSAGDKADANALSWVLNTPQAVWLDGGTPKTVGQKVRQVVSEATDKGTVPVFVAYNLPGRDCANYSGGGALDKASYLAWIDAVAANIGNAKAVVILEPDGLGLLPSNCGAGFPFTDADRYAELNGAVDRFEMQPGVSVYLDATHDAWMSVGDISLRLVTAGVQRAQGFFLNVSNFQWTPDLSFYGTWISDCIALGSYGACPNQYWNGGPATGWNGTAMDPTRVWSEGNSVLALNTSGLTSRYALMLGSIVPTTHFVIDTSRNGVGPWTPPAPYTEDWCNPPDRGVGIRPTANTGVALLDAYLWVKTVGESDGQCTRGTAGPVDPVRGYVDPAAGLWFPQMALELANNANPALPTSKAVPAW